MQLAAFKKVEYLLCGQREILAHGEDYLPIGGLQGETHSHPMPPQQVDSPHNVVCSLRVIIHTYFQPRIDSGRIKVGL